MPSIMAYVDPNDVQRQGILGFMDDETRKRKEEYEKGWRYYKGDQPHQLEKLEDEPDDNVVINVFQQSVDRTLSFLFPAMPELELDPDASAKTDDERWLEEAWIANGGISALYDMGMFGLLSGNTFVRVMPADEQLTGHPYPQIVPLDPLTITPYWRTDDIRRVVWYEVKWQVQIDINKVIYYILDFVNRDGDGWEIIQYINEVGGGTGWKVVTSERWPKERYSPVVQSKHLPQAGSFYGMAETGYLPLNDKINLVSSETNRIIRYHASPKTVATGTKADDIIPTESNELWAIENENAKIYNLEMKTDLESSRRHALELRNAFLAQSRVVILQGEVKDFQRVTNAGVRTVFIDMLSKNIILRWHYGKLIQEISRRLLILGGKGNRVPDVLHQDPLPVDDTERVNIAVLERSMNIVDRETIAKKRGYDWETVTKHLEKEQSMEIFKPPVTAPKPGDNPADKPAVKPPPKE